MVQLLGNFWMCRGVKKFLASHLLFVLAADDFHHILSAVFFIYKLFCNCSVVVASVFHESILKDLLIKSKLFSFKLLNLDEWVNNWMYYCTVTAIWRTFTIWLYFFLQQFGHFALEGSYHIALPAVECQCCNLHYFFSGCRYSRVEILCPDIIFF